MTIHYVPNAEILADIEDALSRHRLKTISVYAEAERIRRKWQDRNIALEDIVAQLVSRGGEFRVVLLFNPIEAADALMGGISPDYMQDDPSIREGNDNRDIGEGASIISLRRK